uniref:Ig-like domain-containing protein n=2 Tax=Roseivirga sp. TaxID=1964215 RepID=UPI0040471E57
MIKINFFKILLVVISVSLAPVLSTSAAIVETTNGEIDKSFAAPTVSSITLSGTPVSSASSVDFIVTFSEAVTGVDLSDFVIDTSAGVSASLSSISGSGTTYTITVNSISGHGTVSIDLKAAGTGIINAATESIIGGYTAGVAHAVGSAFDVSKAIFDGEEDVFSVASEETDPRALAFNADGTKMFVSGLSGQDINEYSLSKAYDVSTAAYAGDGERITGIPVGTPAAMAFNPDGTILHVLLFSPNKIVRYFLSTGFDISSVTSSITTDLIISPSPPRSLAFNHDGTKLSIIGNNTDATKDEIHVYNLSTPFNYGSLSSITQGAFSVTAQETAPVSMAFNSSGTKMFVLGNELRDISEYNLSIPFDVATAVYAGDLELFSVASEESAPRSMAFSADGTKMYIMGRNGDDVNEYSLAPPVITGAVAGQAVSDNVNISPFSSITVADPNGDNVSATITLDVNAKGILSGAGLTGTGPYSLASTDAASLQAALRALVFNPTDDRVALNNSETTTFTLVVSDGTFTDTDNRTTVVSTARGAEVAISSAAVSPTNTFSITITFNEAVTGFLESEITVGNGTASAFNAVSTTVYTATITPAANGVVTVDINADVAQDVSTYGNQAAAQFSITADITSPTITSVSVPANATYKTGDNLNFTINTSENVTVNTGSGVPSLAVTIGSTVRQATFDSGSGTQALAFRYQVVSGDEDTNGIVIGTLDLNSGTMKDVAGNDLVLALNSVGSTTSVLVDGVLPSTTSFTRKTPVGQATNADQVVFLAT